MVGFVPSYDVRIIYFTVEMTTYKKKVKSAEYRWVTPSPSKSLIEGILVSQDIAVVKVKLDFFSISASAFGCEVLGVSPSLSNLAFLIRF